MQPVAVVTSAASPRHIEAVRAGCLRELFRSTMPSGISSMILESRERTNTVVGQNRLDHQTIIDARRAGELHPKVRYRWASKDEPLIWLADAIAGAALAAERGDTTWIERAAVAAKLRVVRIPPLRA